MTEQNIETTGFAPAPPVPPQVPVTPPPAPFPIPKTAPSSQNSVRARAPGWQFQQGKQVTPADARAIIESRVHDETKIYKPGAKLGTQLGFASNTVQGSASIVEQARALKNDPQLIYEFVYNNIEWEPGFSQQKGSLGCLLDGMGNSFDQSDLLVKLLRQAGFTANFVLGTIQLTEAELMAWFGTSDIWGSAAYCGNENIPYQSPVWNGSGWDMVMSHMWVEVVISGTTYVMDPSRKTYSRTAPVSGLATIIGYTPATFLSNAQSGATVTADYAQNMNTANIHSDLTSMTSNLTTWIAANKPDATVDDILGGQSIVPVTLPITFATSLSYQTPGDVPTVWTGNIPLAYQTTLQVQFPDNSGGWCIDETFTSDQLAGTRLTLTYDGSLQPVLKLDGVTIATGIAQGSGTWNSVLLTVVHNGYPVNWYDQQWWQSFIYAGAHYLIGNAWGNLGRGQALLHNKRLAEAKASGAATTSEPVMGEQLALVWFNWAAQASRVSDLVNRIMNCHSMVNHQVGIVSFDSGGVGAFALDIGGVNGSSTNLNNDVTKTPINDTVSAMHGVALEAAVLAQTTGLTPGISTTTVIDAANTAGSKIYKGTTANWNTGSNISAALVTAGYSPSDMNDIYGYLQVGYIAMLADDPTVALGVWTGWGDWLFPNSGAFGLINGSYKGGGAQPGGAGPDQPDVNSGNTTDGQNAGGDPVGLFSGDFYYSNTDIRLGSREFPYGLSFTRTYNSASQYKASQLGLGWTHNHAITARACSDGLLSLGDEFAEQGACSIVELFVATDLITDTSRPVSKLVVASLTGCWWADCVVNNLVVINYQTGNDVYVRQPDGTYTHPAGTPSTLSIVSGLFSLKMPTGITLDFNSAGQIASRVYPGGITVTYSYSAGLLSSISNGRGRSLSFTYASGRLTAVSDSASRSVQFSYDLNNNLETFTDAENKVTSYEYDQPGRMIKYFKPANPTSPILTNTYDSLSRVKSQLSANGKQTDLYFAGSRTELVGPIGDKLVLYNNRFGCSTRIINGLGFESRIEYDGLNRLVRLIAPEGDEVLVTYDTNNNILSKTFVAKAGSGLTNIVRTDTYDPIWSKLNSTQDANGNVTVYDIDPLTGYLLSSNSPAVSGGSPSTSFSYNATGQLEYFTDATGVVTKFVYDSTTEVLLSTTVDFGTSPAHKNLTTVYGYDTFGNITSITSPNGHQFVQTYDNERRLLSKSAPAPFFISEKATYDSNGQLIVWERQDYGSPTWLKSTLTFTLTGKCSSSTNPANETVQMFYDDADRTESVIDAGGNQWNFEYDAVNQLVRTKTPTTSSSRIQTFTANGLLKSIEDGRSQITQYDYDGHNRLSIITYMDSTTEINSLYDANSNVLTAVNRAGQSISMTYDALNRLLTKTPSGGVTVTHSYDLASRLTGLSKPVISGDPSTGLTQFVYDSAGRLAGEIYPDGKSVQREFDLNNNCTKIIWPDGYYVTRTFDQLNRLTAIYLNGSLTPLASYSYDARSRRTLETYDNGVTCSLTYTTGGDLAALTHNFNSSSNTFSFAHSNTHQISAAVASDPSFQWHPSAAGSEVYGTADSGNRYPTVGGASYTYDTNSNLTSDGVWTFAYDSENRLVNASKTGTTVAYLYDPSNRQVQKTVNGVKTRYLYDGISMIASYDTSGNLQNRFIFTDNLDEVVAMVSNSGVVTYFNQDGNRSILAATDSSGAILQKFTYSPYGESSSASGWMFGYTGQRYDSETGLYYYKNRYYSPKLGRFLQPDPLGIKAGLNLLTYAGCDPLNKRDPLGLFDVSDDGWVFTVSIHPVPPYSPLPDWGWHASIIATHYVTHSWSYQVNGRNYAKTVGEITTYDFSAGPSDYNMGGNIMEYAGGGDQKADWRRQTQSGEGIVIKSRIQTGQAGQATFDALLHAAQTFAPVDPQYILLGASVDAHGSNSNNYIAYLLEATNLGRADTKGAWAPGLDQPTPVAPGTRPSLGHALTEYEVSRQIINNYGPIGPYKAAG